MITSHYGEPLPQDYELLIDGCWAQQCTNIITVRQLDTSTLCAHHEREMLDSLFGPPPEECLLTGRYPERKRQ